MDMEMTEMAETLDGFFSSLWYRELIRATLQYSNFLDTQHCIDQNNSNIQRIVINQHLRVQQRSNRKCCNAVNQRTQLDTTVVVSTTTR